MEKYAIVVFLYGHVAQWIEHQIPVLRVGGSNPSVLVKKRKNQRLASRKGQVVFLGDDSASGLRELDILKDSPLPCTFCDFMAEPIPPITLPPITDPAIEGQWLQQSLQHWLDTEFLPEPANEKIANRAREIYVRQRLEGENDLGSLVIAIVTEMRSFNFKESFYGEFAVANAVSDLILDSLGIDRCCGN